MVITYRASGLCLSLIHIYCGDEAEDVNRNRELLRSLLPGESVELVIPHQTHSDHVKVVDTHKQ